MADKQLKEQGLVYDDRTRKGKRDVNEDIKFVKPWPDKSALLALVVDGMGGHQGGKIAAEIVIDTFKELLKQPLPETPESRYQLLLDSFHKANTAIIERVIEEFKLGNSKLKDMGATLVAAIITATECLHLYAGDCRLYHFSQEIPLYMTDDHSVINLLIKSGEITSQDAKNHRMRGVVTSCLGGGQNARLSIAPKWDEDGSPAFRKLHPNDVLLLCSDGLHGAVSDFELQNFTENYNSSPANITEKCVEAALKNGSEDNVTAIAIIANNNSL